MAAGGSPSILPKFPWPSMSVSHGPRLGHVDERGVNGRLAVGMIVAAGVAANFRALEMFLGWIQRQLVHRVEDAALRGLEPVTHIGQRAGNDDRHRIVEE